MVPAPKPDPVTCVFVVTAAVLLAVVRCMQATR